MIKFRDNASREYTSIVKLLNFLCLKLRNENESSKINANHLRLIAKLYKNSARLKRSNNNIY